MSIKEQYLAIKNPDIWPRGLNPKRENESLYAELVDSWAEHMRKLKKGYEILNAARVPELIVELRKSFSAPVDFYFDRGAYAEIALGEKPLTNSLGEVPELLDPEVAASSASYVMRWVLEGEMSGKKFRTNFLRFQHDLNSPTIKLIFGRTNRTNALAENEIIISEQELDLDDPALFQKLELGIAVNLVSDRSRTVRVKEDLLQ